MQADAVFVVETRCTVFDPVERQHRLAAVYNCLIGLGNDVAIINMTPACTESQRQLAAQLPD